MSSESASEHLQVIRTLMERSAYYRRALAPMLCLSGAIGLAGALAACVLKIATHQYFVLFWNCLGILALIGSYFLARKQALKDSEPFWSAPARRVTQALFPPFLTGVFFSLVFGMDSVEPATNLWMLVSGWMICYGCGLHSAGFFTPKGVRWLGLMFVATGIGFYLLASRIPSLQTVEICHYMMGLFFGAGHLLCAGYIWASERRKNAL
ncbi:MAG: hypothetical protein JWN25_2836 [Verrucomicrobiales bacterium]|nr:hypothetical protein [Verrucomicrobiales bacterium]